MYMTWFPSRVGTSVSWGRENGFQFKLLENDTFGIGKTNLK